MFYKFLKSIATVFGIITLILVLASKSTRVKRLLKNQLVSVFQKQAKAQFSMEAIELHCFPPKVILKEVMVTPLNKQDTKQDWSWKAKRIEVAINLLRYFTHKAAGITIKALEYSLYSSLTHKELSVAPHLQWLITPQQNTLPFALTKAELIKSNLIIEDTKENSIASCNYEGSVTQTIDKTSIRLTLTDGLMSRKNEIFFQKLTATAEVDYTMQQVLRGHATASCRLFPGSSQQALCSFTSNMDEKEAMLQIIIGPYTIQAHTPKPLSKKEVSGTVRCLYKNGLLANGFLSLNPQKSFINGYFLTPLGIDLSVSGSLKDATISFKTEIDFEKIKVLLQKYNNALPSGTGTFIVQGTIMGAQQCLGTIQSKQTTIRLGQSYNCIRSINAQYLLDFSEQTATIIDALIILEKGSITSPSIKIGFMTQEPSPLSKKSNWFFHAPFVFSNCFVNWEKNIQMDLSGAIVCSKNPLENPIVKGFVMIESGHLSENIFSPKTQAHLFHVTGMAHDSPAIIPLTLDVTVRTRGPISIKTKELSTTAQVALHAKTIDDTATISGEIILSGGVFHFPAYSLPLIRGSLHFSPDRPHDPVIEIIGQARIKKYLITLGVSGSASDLHITFDSSPSLSQEQIIMLLFAGSEEESLNIVAPSLVMRNVENILFGSDLPLTKHSWLEPLRHIRFVPRFTDQMGRGGFKGTLEIEVNKRLHAIIEKNFSLSEDVFFEVEYQLTDDMSLKASRDQRGDLGAEFEMKFKF